MVSALQGILGKARAPKGQKSRPTAAVLTPAMGWVGKALRRWPWSKPLLAAAGKCMGQVAVADKWARTYWKPQLKGPAGRKEQVRGRTLCKEWQPVDEEAQQG